MRTLILLVLVSISLSVGAKTKRPQAPAPTASYAIWDLDDGRILADKNVEAVRSMASITKLMTVLVTLERGLDLDEAVVVTGSEHSGHIKRGMTLTRRELITLSLVASDNLAANTLSETGGVDKHSFITLMNLRAYTLGMTDTKYSDPVGLSPFNVSTVFDIKTLTEHLERYPLFAESATQPMVAVSATNRNKRVTVNARNTNVFAGKLDIKAAKTGFTNAAGRCLTMLFRGRDNHRYLLVVMGAVTSDQRHKMVTSLIDTIK
jgi:D-alanyl-D-alanine endopeptidase (penicillin-binding protein 7)